MAKERASKTTTVAMHRTMSPPGVFLVRMLIFLTLVAFLSAILHEQLFSALTTNPGLNGLIVGVLGLGILYSFRQVIRLYPEIRWVNAYRIADPGLAIAHRPVLLSPMATMLRDRTGTLSLSTASTRSIMDTIGSRLDE
ncbi:MAG: flagellar motor protein MotA, partial [Hyphomicrobium sp.]